MVPIVLWLVLVTNDVRQHHFHKQKIYLLRIFSIDPASISVKKGLFSSKQNRSTRWNNSLHPGCLPSLITRTNHNTIETIDVYVWIYPDGLPRRTDFLTTPALSLRRLNFGESTLLSPQSNLWGGQSPSVPLSPSDLRHGPQVLYHFLPTGCLPYPWLPMSTPFVINVWLLAQRTHLGDGSLYF